MSTIWSKVSSAAAEDLQSLSYLFMVQHTLLFFCPLPQLGGRWCKVPALLFNLSFTLLCSWLFSVWAFTVDYISTVLLYTIYCIYHHRLSFYIISIVYCYMAKCCFQMSLTCHNLRASVSWVSHKDVPVCPWWVGSVSLAWEGEQIWLTCSLRTGLCISHMMQRPLKTFQIVTSPKLQMKQFALSCLRNSTTTLLPSPTSVASGANHNSDLPRPLYDISSDLQ